MKDFDSFYILLVEDQIWYENASMHHSKITFEATARKVWTIGLADFDNFKVAPISEHRNHVYNKLCKLPPDKVKKTWNEIALEEKQKEIEKNKPPEEPPLVRGSEQYLKRTQEFLEAIQNAPMMKKQAPLTARERIEGDNLRPKPEIKEPTEIEKRSAYVRHLKRVRESRSMLFLEAYPDAEPEEVQEYLKKFAHIDNPLELDI